jgi:hypothetical protein
LGIATAQNGPTALGVVVAVADALAEGCDFDVETLQALRDIVTIATAAADPARKRNLRCMP